MVQCEAGYRQELAYVLVEEAVGRKRGGASGADRDKGY